MPNTSRRYSAPRGPWSFQPRRGANWSAPSAVHRQARQQQAEEKKAEKEAEAARKLRYPIADELLQFEPEPDQPLAPRPAARFGLNLPPEQQHLVGEILSSCYLVCTFGEVRCRPSPA